MTPPEQAIAARLTAIAEKLTRALMDAWLKHPSTKVGEWGKPTDVYFSVKKAVEALAPVVSAHVETLTQQVAELQQARTDDSLSPNSSASQGRSDESVFHRVVPSGRDSGHIDNPAVSVWAALEQAEQQRDAAHAALKAAEKRIELLCESHEALHVAMQQIADHDGDRFDWSGDVAINKPSPQELAQSALDAALAASAPQKQHNPFRSPLPAPAQETERGR